MASSLAAAHVLCLSSYPWSCPHFTPTPIWTPGIGSVSATPLHRYRHEGCHFGMGIVALSSLLFQAMMGSPLPLGS